MNNRWKTFLNSGYSTSVYGEFKSELQARNGGIVRTTSFIGALVMLCLTVISLFLPSVSRVLPLYATVAVAFAVIYVFSITVGRKNGTAGLLCNYAFLTAAFGFALGLDAIQKNATATTVCVLLVALPLLIVDRPVREFFFFLSMAGCFMFESVYIKQSPKASIDVLNAACFLVVGLFLGYRHNQSELQHFVSHRLLEHERDTDTLTSLYNKGAVENRATAYLSDPDATAAMMILDMDDFKHVNDAYGHHTGDEILTKIADVLAATFRSSDYISRFGGDEFIVFMPGTQDTRLLRRKAEQILTRVGALRIDADPNYRAQVCIGIATYPQDGHNYESLFQSADSAMYEVKRGTKNSYQFHSGEKRTRILVVDDIELNREVIAVNLIPEYEVLEAEDGETALQLLAENPDIAMVITDVHMPGMDGLALIKAIKAEPAYRNIAVVANTQYDDKILEERILALGVDDFIYKAASSMVVRNRVKNVLLAKMGN